MATITVTVQTTAGAIMDDGPDDPIRLIIESGDATVDTSTQLVLPHPELDREVVINGIGMVFDVNDNPTGGTVTQLIVRGKGDGLPVIATIDIEGGMSFVALVNAIDAIIDEDDETQLDALLDSFVFDFTGNIGPDAFFGADQSDFLRGGGGDDTLGGEAGNDTIGAAGGDDSVIGDEIGRAHV